MHLLNSIILFSIKNKLIIGILMLALMGWGGYSLSQLPIDAVPDITTNQIQILTQSPTLAAQEVEQYVTTPLELSLANIPDVTEIRSISKQGLSVITLVFNEKTDILRAKQWVSEQMKTASGEIPAEFGRPDIAPLTTGLGEIYQYVLVPKKGYEHRYDLTQLRSIQDWVVKRQLAGIPGVIETSSFGGFVKQYEVRFDPERLRAANISVAELFEALSRNNANTGGSYIEKDDQAYFIRGEGTLSTTADIGNIVVRSDGARPVRVQDVASVGLGHANRFGALTRNGEGEAVGGIVLMLKGANSEQTVNEVKKRVARIQNTLPEGLEIQPFIERTKLIKKTISTVTENLLLGGLIVVFVLVLLMGSLRAGLIAASVIPLAMLFTLGMMNTFGISANLMSLGAIDFGVIVDGAVIIVEAIVHRFQLWRQQHGLDNVESQEEIDGLVYETSIRIRDSAAFGEMIILIVYLPVLSLVGIEGRMFRPMALTVGFAIVGAFLLSLTYVPMVSSLFLGKKLNRQLAISEKILNTLYRWYAPLLRMAWRAKALTVAIAVGLFAGSLLIFSQLGGEFIPTLDEGDLAIDFRTPPGTSLTKTVDAALAAQRSLMRHFPEVKQVVGRVGASEIPTDPMPIEMVDQMINMAPHSEWTSAKNREEMAEKMTAVLEKEVPGTMVEFTQPIQMRFNEMITGSRSDVAVKIYGNDLDVLTERANACVPLIEKIKGVASVRVEQLVGLPQISLRYRRDRLAEYGLNIADLNRLVRASFAGETAGVVFEGERRFDLVVRLDSAFRQDISNIRNLYVPLPNGGAVPFEQLAEVRYVAGPAQIPHDDTHRRITLGIGVRGRDVESVVNDIRSTIEARVKLPTGYYYTYGGAFENLQKAKQRLSVAVPLALGLIFLLLYFTFGSLKEALLIFSAVPLSAIGGILALWLRGMPFSISAGVGFIALFGVAVLNGIVLVAYLNQLEQEGVTDLTERVWQAVAVRFRPVVMTATVASLGFLPMALSTSGGAEVQRPLATVVIGGILSATLLTLVVLPVLYAFMKTGFSFRRKKAAVAAAFLGALGLAAPTHAQAPLTLEQTLSRGFEQNRSLASGQLSVRAQQALRGTAYDYDRTNLDAQLGQTQARPFDYTVAVSQQFSSLGYYRARQNLADGQIRLAESQLSLSRIELAYNIKQEFYRLLHLHRLAGLVRSQDSLYARTVAAARLRYQTGETGPLEQSLAETAFRQNRNRIANLEADFTAGYRRLGLLLFSENSVQIDTTVSLKRPLSPQLLANSREYPLLALLQQQAENTRLETQVIQQQFRPVWRIGLTSQSIESRPGFTYGTFGLGIPLFRKAQQARVQAARLTEERAILERQNTAFQLQQQVSIRLTELEKAQRAITYYETSALPQADLLLRTAARQFQVGEIDYVAFSQSIQAVAQIREEYLNTLLTYSQAVIELERFFGLN